MIGPRRSCGEDGPAGGRLMMGKDKNEAARADGGLSRFIIDMATYINGKLKE